MADILSQMERLAVAVGEAALGMVGLGIDAAPALVLGLALLAALPVLLLVGIVFRSVAARGDGAAAQEPRTTMVSGGTKPVRAGASTVRAAKGFENAKLVFRKDQDGETEFSFGTAVMLRIGREDDNDIQLLDPTVHRYHALVRRSVTEGYEIADLSDASGNGVLVNGDRVSHARLACGDVIRLGAAELKFVTERAD